MPLIWHFQYTNAIVNTADIHSSVSLTQLATSILLHDDACDTNFMNLVLLRTKGFFHIAASTRVHRKSSFCFVTLRTSSSALSYTQREFISAFKYGKVKSSLIRGSEDIAPLILISKMDEGVGSASRPGHFTTETPPGQVSYRYALHKDVSVNEEPHIRRWSHNTL